MRYFLDTEFVDDGETIMLISLALVREDDRELYLELEFDDEKARAHDFVRENVLPHLQGQKRCSKEQAAQAILEFLGLPAHPSESKPDIEIWAYYASYDWVAWCQLFGSMVDLPQGMPWHPMDLQQWWVQLGRPAHVKPPDPTKAHHALADADWNKTLYLRLERYARWFHGGVGRDPTAQWEALDRA